MKKLALLTALLAAFAASTTSAQQHPAGHEAHGASASAPLTDGEVRKVDKEAKKLTIRHGPIANLDMPPMTMVFQVQDSGTLESVKVGDKIKFHAEKSGGAYTATKVELAK